MGVEGTAREGRIAISFAASAANPIQFSAVLCSIASTSRVFQSRVFRSHRFGPDPVHLLQGPPSRL